MDQENNDLSALCYEEFIEYFFPSNREPSWDSGLDGVRLRQYDIKDTDAILRYLTRFFTEFRHLANHRTIEELCRGVTGMMSGGYCELQRVLWDNSLDLQERIECIRSMRFVFTNFVAACTVEVLESCFYMWWDFICSSFWYEQTYDKKLPAENYSLLGEQDRKILDAIFETLVEILQIDDDRTKDCAFHGLGHVHHPGVREVVQEFINGHAGVLPPDRLSWLEACRDGTVM